MSIMTVCTCAAHAEHGFSTKLFTLLRESWHTIHLVRRRRWRTTLKNTCAEKQHGSIRRRRWSLVRANLFDRHCRDLRDHILAMLALQPDDILVGPAGREARPMTCLALDVDARSQLPGPRSLLSVAFGGKHWHIATISNILLDPHLCGEDVREIVFGRPFFLHRRGDELPLWAPGYCYPLSFSLALLGI